MTQTVGFQKMKQFASAARSVLEEGTVDASKGRFSKTLFLACVGNDPVPLQCAIAAGITNGLGAVLLIFGPGSKSSGPRAYTAVVEGPDGNAQVFQDCALVEVEGGRLILVPRGRGAHGHLAIGPSGLELRPGRPNALGPGMVKAAQRLASTAKNLRELGPFIDIHRGPLAA